MTLPLIQKLFRYLLFLSMLISTFWPRRYPLKLERIQRLLFGNFYVVRMCCLKSSFYSFILDKDYLSTLIYSACSKRSFFSSLIELSVVLFMIVSQLRRSLASLLSFSDTSLSYLACSSFKAVSLSIYLFICKMVPETSFIMETTSPNSLFSCFLFTCCFCLGVLVMGRMISCLFSVPLALMMLHIIIPSAITFTLFSSLWLSTMQSNIVETSKKIVMTSLGNLSIVKIYSMMNSSLVSQMQMARLQCSLLIQPFSRLSLRRVPLIDDSKCSRGVGYYIKP